MTASEVQTGRSGVVAMSCQPRMHHDSPHGSRRVRFIHVRRDHLFHLLYEHRYHAHGDLRGDAERREAKFADR